MSIQEIQELYRVALTWTDGDESRAWAMVDAYLRGRTEGWTTK